MSFFDDRDVELRGSQLSGKRLDVVVAGGIAAIETPKLIRELRRYGADVHVFMTEAATEFVRPLVFEWASKNKVVTKLSGTAEHITHADAVIVSPATLDFISKIAMGFAEGAAGTLVQSAISRMPVFFCPSMHLSLEQNPIYQKNLESLREIKNIQILSPVKAEGKAKIASFENIAAKVCHELNREKFKEQPVTISLGPTRSYADDVRYLSNYSSGTLGLTIADELYRSGADVSVIAGPVSIRIPSYIKTTPVETIDEMKTALESDIKARGSKIAIFAAAVLDFEIAEKVSGKTSSKENWSIELKPTPKLIAEIEGVLKVGFKLESKISSDELKSRIKDSAAANDCAYVVGNLLEDVSESKHKALIWSHETKCFTEANSKKEIATELVKFLKLKSKIATSTKVISPAGRGQEKARDLSPRA
jgi:phosphopantothenoylcysteine decarboxylase/phosphopantothenate--cysteine ligase